MILARNVFRLKYGKAREALALMKEGLALQKRAGIDLPTRLLTDITGSHYTLVLELTAPSVATFETTMPQLFNNPEFRTNYEKFAALVESGHRDLFTIVE